MAESLSYICPFCEVEVAVGKPCAGCEKQSREQDSADKDFDYENFVAEEFGKIPYRNVGLRWYWWLLAVLVLFGMIYGIFK